MSKYKSSTNLFWKSFKFIGNIINYIFKYLSCSECDPSDNRMLLRNLYNTGQIDEGQYHQFCERCSDDSFDPEAIHRSM